MNSKSGISLEAADHSHAQDWCLANGEAPSHRAWEAITDEANEIIVLSIYVSLLHKVSAVLVALDKVPKLSLGSGNTFDRISGEAAVLRHRPASANAEVHNFGAPPKKSLKA